MVTTTARRTAADVWVELIDAGRCACRGCDGSLASSQYPSWRVCVECRCHWTVSAIHGKRREGLFADPRCPARTADRDESGRVEGYGGRSDAEVGRPAHSSATPIHARGGRLSR